MYSHTRGCYISSYNIRMLAKRKKLGIPETDPRFHKAFITGLSSMRLRKTLAKFYNLETKKPDFQWEMVGERHLKRRC